MTTKRRLMPLYDARQEVAKTAAVEVDDLSATAREPLELSHVLDRDAHACSSTRGYLSSAISSSPHRMGLRTWHCGDGVRWTWRTSRASMPRISFTSERNGPPASLMISKSRSTG